MCIRRRGINRSQFPNIMGNLDGYAIIRPS